MLVRKTEYEQCTEYIMTMYAHNFSTSILLQCFLLSLVVENLLTYGVARVRNTVLKIRPQCTCTYTFLKLKQAEVPYSICTVSHLGNLKIKPKKIALVDELF